MKDKAELKKVHQRIRREYKLEHGHSQNDHKAKESCVVCKEKWEKIHKVFQEIDLSK